MSKISPSLLGSTSGFNHEPTRSCTLPARFFYDPEIFEREKEAIFYKTWQYAGPAQELSEEPGSYVTCKVLDENIVITRAADGEMRAFHNICLHRGCELVEGKGTNRNKLITCPFHGWQYNMTGNLIQAPQTKKIIGFEKDKIHLKEVQVEKFLNLLFVNLDMDAPSLISQAGELDSHYRKMLPGIDAMKWTNRFHADVGANWRSVVENVLENYHTFYTHPGFEKIMDMKSFKTTCYDIHVTSIAKNITDSVADDDLWSKDSSDEFILEGSYDGIFPNTCMFVLPGTPHYVVVHSMPSGPERTFETWDFFFRTDPPTATEKEVPKFCEDVLNPQDIVNLERAQRGMHSRAWDEGRFVIDEDHSWFSELPTHFIDALTLKYLEGSNT